MFGFKSDQNSSFISIYMKVCGTAPLDTTNGFMAASVFVQESKYYAMNEPLRT